MTRIFKSLAVVGLLAVTVGCTRVGPGHVGIKVSMAGDNRGVSDTPAVTGWVFYNPFLSSVFEYPTFVQTVVWTKSATEGNPINEEISFTNKDKMLIAVDVNLSYHLEGQKVPAFYVKFRSDDLNAFTLGYMRNLARDSFNTHAGRYSIDQIMGDNAAFVQDVRQSLQGELTPIGVVLDQFGIIGAPRPPQAVTDQINASVHASQLATQKQNELVQVEADMAKERSKTDTYARNLLVEAQAQADANRKISSSLTPELVQLKRLEKWDGKLPYINGGSTNPFVSVGQAQEGK